MAAADDTDQAQAEELVRLAGGVHPMTGFAMATQPGGNVSREHGLRVGRRRPARRGRSCALASGPAPGQGGDFTDRFRLASATARGTVVQLDLSRSRAEYVLSDLTSGPVLFATC